MSPPQAHLACDSAQHLFGPQRIEEYVAAMRLATDHLTDKLRSVAGPATGRTPASAAAAVARVDLDTPLGDAGAALRELDGLYLDDAVWFHDPGYAAHLNCPVVIPALLAEVLVSAVNSSLDTFDQSVGGTFVERRLIEWTARRIGFDARADGVFTSGGTQSNLQALHMARDRAAGVAGDLADLRILASRDAHFSVQKSVRLLGLGPDAVVPVATDDRRRLDPAALARELATLRQGGLTPMAVVATAGTTDFGAIDPITEISALCVSHRAWLHVDAAYGGGLLVSSRHRERLAGIERADSVTIDYHKTWFQPVSSSAVLVRDSRSLSHVAWHADYLNPAGETQPNQVDKSLQTTRRFDALKLWLTLRVMGAGAIGCYVDAVVDLARAAYDRLRDEPRIEMAAAPELSTLVLRYRPAGFSEEAADELVPRIRAALYESGSAMVAATRVDGRRWLKLTLLNPLCEVAEVLAIVERIAQAGDDLADGVAVA